MKQPAVLIAAGDEALRRTLKVRLLRHRYRVIESRDKTSALRSVRTGDVDLAIVGSADDEALDGLEVTREIRRSDRRIPLILIATNSSEELAIAALRAGISDYFKQPLSVEELVMSVDRCLADTLPWEPAAAPDTAASSVMNAQQMLGKSLPMQAVRAYIAKVASTDSNVLLTGETGTGKELAAELIHRSSRRRQSPFMGINCAAIPDTLIESELFGYERGAFTGAHAFKEGTLKLADGGSVFFDEIGDMSPYAQAKILRAIESKEVHRLGGKASIPDRKSTRLNSSHSRASRMPSSA